MPSESNADEYGVKPRKSWHLKINDSPSIGMTPADAWGRTKVPTEAHEHLGDVLGPAQQLRSDQRSTLVVLGPYLCRARAHMGSGRAPLGEGRQGGCRPRCSLIHGSRVPLAAGLSDPRIWVSPGQGLATPVIRTAFMVFFHGHEDILDVITQH